MRIEVRRTGGFAGMERRAEVETRGLTDEDEWHSLAARALGDSAPAPGAGVPDGFHYTLTVDDRTVHFADPGLTEAQRLLVHRLLTPDKR